MSSTLTKSIAVEQAAQHENTVLADLVDAIETYPTNYLTLEIYDIDPPGSGTGINEGEDVTFKVHVHNSGPLNVDNLTLLIEALPGADGVKLHGSTVFKSNLTSAAIAQVPAHMAADTWVETPEGHYHFEAGPHSDGSVDLIRVSIDQWDADLDHPLKAHSDPVPSDNAVFSHHVLKA
jgi:hypothetical protein